ncbi:NAD(P)-binding protein [Delitschia confertaspora ATCC 74209]|uniref:NAD(P)-binding protein n=1 Tax=Delitschia confertaspora ATCC 74209 TaxID=1513339 RepID=A0A9P4MVL7_9PLEO|nr:NAD(P)-binding protein [Delitschia confertaspora ATCC 74209]
MPTTKIFLTGATGYIGGTVLDTLFHQRPDYHITVLLRKIPDGFQEKYPNVEIVIGDYDDSDLVSATAAQANIVVHGGNSKHEAVIKAHLAGLLTRPEKSFFIRLGGTGVIADWKDGPYGELNPKVWSDIDDIDTLTSMPDWALHRPVEKLIQATAEANGEMVKCAIICSSGVYGKGKGMVRTRSLYMPEFYGEILKLGYPFYTGSGGNRRGWVHIEDLMRVYLSLIDAAAVGGGNAVWGKEGYYFTATQEASQLELATAAGKILYARGVIDTEEPKKLSIEEIGAMTLGSSWPYMGFYTFACNTRAKADRARKYLGYEPRAPSVFECMEEDLREA